MSKKKRRANGEYSVYENKANGTWRGQVTIGVDEEGKYIRKSASGKTKGEVIEKLQMIDNKVKTGLYLDKSQITIYHLCMQMLDEDHNLNNIKDNTYYRYIETLKRMKDIYNIPIQSLSEMTLQAFMLNQKDYSQEVIGKIYSLLNRVIKEAVKRKIITTNIMEEVKKPKTTQIKKIIRALSEDEERALFDVLVSENVQYNDIMLLSMLTGMRIGEITALQVKDVNFRFNTVTVRRTMSRGEKGEAILGKEAKTDAGKRTFQMSEDVAHIFKDAIGDKKPNDMIFLKEGTKEGQLIPTSNVYCQFRRVLDKYGIIDESIEGTVDLHSLRHTFATRCIEANMPPKVLQKLLGHADIKTTMNIYTSVTDKYESSHINEASKYLKSLGISYNHERDDAQLPSGFKLEA